jgi:hypothetical protein
MRRNVLILLLTFVGATSAAARDIFVDNLAGDDRRTGTSRAGDGVERGPVQTIAKAMRTARPGDRIVITDTGTPYREAVTIQAGRNSGLAADLPFIVEGNGAVIDGSVAIPDEAWEHVIGDVFRYSPDIKSHQVLLLEGRPAIRVPTERGQKELPPLEPLQWCLLQGQIYFRVETGRVPPQYFPACAGYWTGITLYEVRDVIIRNVIVRGFAFDGINAHDNAFNVRLEDTLCRDNGRSGFSIGGASRVALERCEATFNHTVQLRTEGYSHAHLRDCVLDAATAPATETDGGEIIDETPPAVAPAP